MLVLNNFLWEQISRELGDLRLRRLKMLQLCHPLSSPQSCYDLRSSWEKFSQSYFYVSQKCPLVHLSWLQNTRKCRQHQLHSKLAEMIFICCGEEKTFAIQCKNLEARLCKKFTQSWVFPKSYGKSFSNNFIKLEWNLFNGSR